MAVVYRLAGHMLRLQASAPAYVPPSNATNPPCIYGPEVRNTYCAGVVDTTGPTTSATLAGAEALCNKYPDCGGITQQYGSYGARAGNVALNGSNGSPSNAWVITNLLQCGHGTDVPAGTGGLIRGAPEHDWSGTTSLAFYNNNAWVATGLERLGAFLSEGPAPRNASFAATLLTAGRTLNTAVLKSVAACSVLGADGEVVFLPPYAAVNATPFKSMFESRESSYSNFRFFSEPMMASVMPPAVEAAWLHMHNDLGGRVGGANRFEGWLDDMPSVGWGWGALANNKTDDFLGLLYGHMATYQSSGTFHSTEQLSFHGSGRYRGFNRQADPAPYPSSASAAVHEPVAERGPERVGLGYNSAETDISFCIVSNIIVALLTRWQLVMEENVGPSRVWLGRGAPTRWFRTTGFNVTAAPTAVGTVSYQMVPAGPSAASYAVSIDGSAPAMATLWSLRWPGALSAAKCVSGCGIAAQDSALGIVTVRATASTFTVSAGWAARR